MEAERERYIGGSRVQEFYWAGDYPVYVDNRLVEGSYEEVCEIMNRGEVPRYVKR